MYTYIYRYVLTLSGALSVKSKTNTVTGSPLAYIVVMLCVDHDYLGLQEPPGIYVINFIESLRG